VKIAPHISKAKLLKIFIRIATSITVMYFVHTNAYKAGVDDATDLYSEHADTSARATQHSIKVLDECIGYLRICIETESGCLDI
jgi:hypothetical protein